MLAALLLILGAGLVVYTQATGFDFVYFDDDEYVFKNPKVLQGLSTGGTRWAFTTFQSKHWHPLTWLSHMVDAELFGSNPVGHHAMNLGLHLLNALLLFWFLERTTRDRVPALLVALAFTVHPLHVENVAWVASRKDLLCAFFWMVTLHAYTAYVRRPGFGRYTLVLVTFCLATLSKSMAVTLPIVLLLLDRWPLSRTANEQFPQPAAASHRHGTGIGWLVIEKLPLLTISLLIGLVTLEAIRSYHVHTPIQLPEGSSLTLGSQAFLVYLMKLFYPVGLITPYPIVVDLSSWMPVFSGFMVLVLTIGTILFLKSHPYLFVGWGWYLVTLMPVAGFFGPPRVANRYAYLPLIGIYILLAWSMVIVWRRWPRFKVLLLFVLAGAMSVLTGLAYQQTATWRDTPTLFNHTLKTNPRSAVAHVNIGVYLYAEGRYKEASDHQRQAVLLSPQKAEYHYNLGVSLLRMKDTLEALEHFTRAAQLRPDYVEAMSNRGLCLLQLGKLEAAQREFTKVLDIEPDHAHTLNHLGLYHVARGDLTAAEIRFRQAITAKPGYADAMANLAGTLANKGITQKAEELYRAAIQIAPAKPNYYFGLASLLTLQKKFKDAVALRRQGLLLAPENAEQHYFLAVDEYFTGNLRQAWQQLEQAKMLGYLRVEKLFEEELAQGLSTLSDENKGTD